MTRAPLNETFGYETAASLAILSLRAWSRANPRRSSTASGVTVSTREALAADELTTLSIANVFGTLRIEVGATIGRGVRGSTRSRGRSTGRGGTRSRGSSTGRGRGGSRRRTSRLAIVIVLRICIVAIITVAIAIAGVAAAGITTTENRTNESAALLAILEFGSRTGTDATRLRATTRSAIGVRETLTGNELKTLAVADMLSAIYIEIRTTVSRVIKDAFRLSVRTIIGAGVATIGRGSRILYVSATLWKSIESAALLGSIRTGTDAARLRATARSATGVRDAIAGTESTIIAVADALGIGLVKGWSWDSNDKSCETEERGDNGERLHCEKLRIRKK